MKLDLLIHFILLCFINLCLGCFANCDDKCFAHCVLLCIHYDCFYICKDLTEGEINQSINQSPIALGPGYTRDWLPACRFVLRARARRDTTRQDLS